jgi:hypothetical protein
MRAEGGRGSRDDAIEDRAVIFACHVKDHGILLRFPDFAVLPLRPAEM